MSELLDEQIVSPLRSFAKNSIMLVQKCSKPNYREFTRLGLATVAGFAIMGFAGFIVKIVFIPINSILMGQ